MKRNILIFLMLFLSTNLVMAQGLAKVGTAGYQFMKIGMDARGEALADAIGPLLDDSRAVLWNPAMLVKMENWSASFTHTNFLAGIRMQAFSFAKQMPGIGAVGVFGTILNSGDIEETTVFQQGGTGRFFSTQSYTFGISFARMLTDKFGMGGTFKYVSEDLTKGLDGGNRTGAWAFDLGTVYYPGFKNLESLRLVMYIRNFGPEVRLSGTHIDFDKGQVLPEPAEYSIFPLPLLFNFGIGMELWETEMNKLSLAIIGEHPNDNLERINTGLEYWWNDMLALRAGYVYNHDSRTLSGGVGFKLNTFDSFALKLDYAYVDYGILDMTQFITLTIDW